jgi:hypothetical protein
MRLEVVQVCSSCHQRIDVKPDPKLTCDVNLSGAEKYVVCPTCNKVVPEAMRTSAYKAIWSRKYRERTKEAKATQRTPPSRVSERRVVTPEEWIREREEFEARIAMRQRPSGSG